MVFSPPEEYDGWLGVDGDSRERSEPVATGTMKPATHKPAYPEACAPLRLVNRSVGELSGNEERRIAGSEPAATQSFLEKRDHETRRRQGEGQ